MRAGWLIMFIYPMPMNLSIVDDLVYLYDDLKLNDELLIIPHPRMTIRAFVLIPLAEIAKNIQIEGRTVHELISAINQYEVRKLIR